MRACGWTVVLGWTAWVVATAAAAPAEGFAAEPPSSLASAPSPLPNSLKRLPSGAYPKECSAGDIKCFPKCCPLGEYLEAKTCVAGYSTEFDPFIVDDKNVSGGWDLSKWGVLYNLVIGNPCKGEWVRVDYTEIDVWSTGELVLYENSETNESIMIQPKKFCLEYLNNVTEAIICAPSDSREIFKGFYTSGMVISVTGLVLTLIVYLTVDTLRDLHGKSLICHVGCLAIAYILLVAVQLTGNFGTAVCTGVAFAIQFFLLSSFIWLHVMCMDAFWCVLEATGSSPIPYPRAKKWLYDTIRKQWVTGLSAIEVDEKKEEECKLREKMTERRVFAVYSLYAWTLSFLPVIAVVGHNLSPTIPATYVDHNMETHCVVNNEKSEKSLLYFYPFTAIFILFNIIIFICITIKAVRFNWNISGPHRVPKQKARMVFLLFVLMSSSWIIDLISWAIRGKPVVWVMLHAFYILQGLITFLIFVLEDRVKDRVIHKLWPRIRRINKKYGCCNRTKNEEEVTALRENCPPCNSRTVVGGWVSPS